MKTRLIFIVLIFFLTFLSSASCFPEQVQPDAEHEAEIKRASTLLYDDHNLEEALAVLEKLAGENPGDLYVIELLSVCLVSYSSALEEGSSEWQNALVRSRQLAQKAKELGSKYLMMDLILNSVSGDENVIMSFSKDKIVDNAMKMGEAFFARNELDQALEAYRSVEVLDSNRYIAPLFIGDCYYLLRQTDNAERAFARAIAIDPNRETAYRYWGDGLMKSGKMEEARVKFIEAIVAEPYKPQPWNGLRQWALLNKKEIGHFQCKIPITVLPGRTLAVNEEVRGAKNGTLNWLAYGQIRLFWLEEIFSKAYPDEKQYRHSLVEECDAIRMMLHGVTDQISKGELKSADVDGSIQLLMRLNSEGLLEPYILLALADEGISQDYESYRMKNRETIRRYLDRYVIHDKK